MTVRPPAVAGQFYDISKKALRDNLARLVDKNSKKENYLGVISPHAGYIYSGKVAGNVLSRIRFKDTVIILGPNHTGMGEPFAIMSSGSWRTPIGEIEIDSEAAKLILKSSSLLKEDASAHAYEHSIEVQLPFLQYLNERIKFVPITIQHAPKETLIEIGKELAGSLKDLGREVVIITSSDMTHFEGQDTARVKDQRAIEAILKLDEDLLLEVVKKWDITMCGYAPAVVMLRALKDLGARKAELIEYTTSADTSGDYESVVGYAGILIK